MAAENGDFDVVRELAKDPRTKLWNADRHGTSPVAAAAGRGFHDIVTYILHVTSSEERGRRINGYDMF